MTTVLRENTKKIRKKYATKSKVKIILEAI